MRSPTTDIFDMSQVAGSLPTVKRTLDKTHGRPELLQCTPSFANDEMPDSRYWTTYDRYMIERQARAIRREFVYGLITNAWRRLRERLIAASPVRASGPHR